jgi:hypothetical protein
MYLGYVYKRSIEIGKLNDSFVASIVKAVLWYL